MSVLVNGVDIRARPETTNELSAARELLRQRAVAVGILDVASTDEEAILSEFEAIFSFTPLDFSSANWATRRIDLSKSVVRTMRVFRFCVGRTAR